MIRRHPADNESHNNRTGYHETITLAWIAVIERFLDGRDRNRPVSVLAGQLLEEYGDREYLSRFYSRERLDSNESWQMDFARPRRHRTARAWPEGTLL